jgi:hypothetical protein
VFSVIGTGDFQAALYTAQPGQIIELAVGTT